MAQTSSSSLAMSAAFSRLEIGGRADAIVQRIVEAIMLGLLDEGQQLPSENDLATQFGVATGTVREALTILRQQGLVETRRGRGGGSFVRLPQDGQAALPRARVRDISTAELRDLGDELLAVSGTAARLAAERAPTNVANSLSPLVAALRTADTPAEQRRADARFHIEVAVTSQSVRLTHAEVRLQAELSPLLWLIDETPDVQEIAERHHAIVVAIASGAATEARLLAEEHATANVRHVMGAHLRLVGP